MSGWIADGRALDALDNRHRIAHYFEAIKIEGDGKQSIPLHINDMPRRDIARIGALPDVLPATRSQILNNDFRRVRRCQELS